MRAHKIPRHPGLPGEEHRGFPAPLPLSPFYPPDLDEGPFDVAVAISDSEANAETEEGTSTEEEDAEKEAVETRLVVFGSSAIVDSGIYNGVTKNDAYMFAYAIGWMCNYEDSISISAKSLTEESLVITDGQVNLWMTVYLLIPAAIIAVGVGVTVYRRRR